MSKREETNQKVSLKMKGKYTLSGGAREINISHMKKPGGKRARPLNQMMPKVKKREKELYLMNRVVNAYIAIRVKYGIIKF